MRAAVAAVAVVDSRHRSLCCACCVAKTGGSSCPPGCAVALSLQPTGRPRRRRHALTCCAEPRPGPAAHTVLLRRTCYAGLLGKTSVPHIAPPQPVAPRTPARLQATRRPRRPAGSTAAPGTTAARRPATARGLPWCCTATARRHKPTCICRQAQPSYLGLVFRVLA